MKGNKYCKVITYICIYIKSKGTYIKIDFQALKFSKSIKSHFVYSLYLKYLNSC